MDFFLFCKPMTSTPSSPGMVLHLHVNAHGDYDTGVFPCVSCVEPQGGTGYRP
jgi:hypothetical protein